MSQRHCRKFGNANLFFLYSTLSTCCLGINRKITKPNKIQIPYNKKIDQMGNFTTDNNKKFNMGICAVHGIKDKK